MRTKVNGRESPLSASPKILRQGKRGQMLFISYSSSSVTTEPVQPPVNLGHKLFCGYSNYSVSLPEMSLP